MTDDDHLAAISAARPNRVDPKQRAKCDWAHKYYHAKVDAEREARAALAIEASGGRRISAESADSIAAGQRKATAASARAREAQNAGSFSAYQRQQRFARIDAKFGRGDGKLRTGREEYGVDKDFDSGF